MENEVLENKTINDNDILSMLQSSPQRRGNSKPLKDKVLRSIDKELELLDERDNLEYQTLSNGKKEDGRFWRLHPINDDSVVLNIKHKKKIFKFNGENKVFIVDKNIESVKERLQSVRSFLSQKESNDSIFDKENCGLDS
jgi:hypothetical protein